MQALLGILLFVPGNRLNMMEKALNLPADALVFDLEDSVSIAEKEPTRSQIAELLKDIQPAKGQQLHVRVNSLGSGLAEADLKAVIGAGLDGVNLPKINSSEDIKQVEGMIEILERERKLEVNKIKFIAWIETAKDLANVFSIACASSRILAIAFGAED